MSSADFIYEQKKDEKKLENTLRQRINAWANSIPHHPYQNLGDKIELVSIWYKPAYPIKLLSQYEERIQEKGFRPYKNDSIPKRTLFDLKDFNAWDIKLDDVEKFVNSDDNYIVSGSQHVEDCHRCDAKGWITCSACGGAGKKTCSSCSGRGEVKCSSCGGGGSQRCNTCSGRGSVSRTVTRSRQVWVPQQYDSNGYTVGNTGMYRTESYTAYENQSCGSCNGTGRRTCSNCSGAGKVRCRPCGGSGIIICSGCSGRGRNTCPVCSGQTKLLHYFFVNRKLNYTNQKTCIIHSEVYDKFPEFLENYSNYHSYSLYVNCEDKLDKEQLAKGNHINPFLDKFIEKSHKEDTNTHCMLFQQAEVDCIDVLELKYRFNGKDYVMLFQGNKKEIIPGLSPVYEVSFEYWEQGIKAAKNYMYSKAWKLLTKASQINTYEIKGDIKYALNAVRNKIEKTFEFGILLGFLISLLLGGFIAFTYFSEVNYVLNYASFINKPSNFLYRYHAWAQLIVYAGVIYFCMNWAKRKFKHLAVKIPGGGFVRLLAGLVLMSSFNVVVLAVLAALNITGLTIIFTFALWVIGWILKIAIFIIVLVFKIVIWLLKAIWGILKWFWGLFF